MKLTNDGLVFHLSSRLFRVLAICDDHLHVRFQFNEWEYVSRDEAVVSHIMNS